MSEEQLLISRRIRVPPAIDLDERQMARLEPRAYTKVAILMHWVMALFILLNLSVGFFMETFANPSPQRSNVLFYHASIAAALVRTSPVLLG
jgi:cytochrome b561